jgi:hypothetical protein
MRLKPELVPPDYPILTGYKLPGDKQTIQALTNNLSNLYRSSKQFSADVALYEWCGRMDSSAATADHFGLWYEWRFVAGRDGAFAARNYGKALEAVQALALRVKDLKEISRGAPSVSLAGSIMRLFPRSTPLGTPWRIQNFTRTPERISQSVKTYRE